MQGTDFIAEYLRRHAGVTHVFTYAGGTSAWLLDALQRANGITYIPMRHEQNAAFAADGYARASGRLGVAATMSGPGATNLITGVADAYFDSVPVLFLTSQVTTGTYKYDRPTRQSGYQETDIVSIAEPITKFSALAGDERSMLELLRRSIQQARGGRAGPALLDIPSDIQRKEVPDSELDVPPPPSRTPEAPDADVSRALELFKASKRPLILAGGGVRSADAQPILLKFAERFNFPVVVSLLGKDSFPHDHPQFVGFIGSYGNRYANLALANCDLLLAIGSRLDSRQTASPKTFARAARKIHVDIDPHELGNTIHCDLTVHADLRSFLSKAMEASEGCPTPSYPDWTSHISRMRHDFMIDGVGRPEAVNPKGFLNLLSQASRGDEIFLADVGNHQMWAAQELALHGTQRFLSSGGLGTMGFSIPAGIGAQFACPGRPVIAMAGDGGFQMSIPELQTIAHNKLPIKIIIFNNGILGLMWHFQNENFSGAAHPATEDGYSCPDIQLISKAYGIPSRKAADDRDISDHIRWLLEHEGPALLELAVHPSWAGYPKVKPGNPLEVQQPEIRAETLARYMLIPL